jgi:hypothetical protein
MKKSGKTQNIEKVKERVGSNQNQVEDTIPCCDPNINCMKK